MCGGIVTPICFIYNNPMLLQPQFTWVYDGQACGAPPGDYKYHQTGSWTYYFYIPCPAWYPQAGDDICLLDLVDEDISPSTYAGDVIHLVILDLVTLGDPDFGRIGINETPIILFFLP